jgi:tetratricopeptide (TPR) repeat protein
MGANANPAQVYASAVEALNRGDWNHARSLASGILQHAPKHAGVHFVLGVAALQLRDMRVAFDHLAQAARLNPSRADYAAQWARALASAHFTKEALAEAERGLRLEPGDPVTLDTLGVVFTQAHSHQRAVDVFKRAVTLRPDQPDLRFNLATSLTFSGDLAAAEVEHEACIGLAPRYWKAHLALSHLRRQSDDANHVTRLQALLAEAASDPEAQLYLNLALEKEYDDLGNYEKAFQHLVSGKSAWGATLGYDPGRDVALVDALVQHGPSAVTSGRGCSSTEPIFVIGMPRTGTTLVDRILSSHPSVTSAGELNNFGVALKRLSGSRTAPLIDIDTVVGASALDWERLGNAYLASTRPVAGHTRHFVDKLPHNFLYAGFIAKAFPEARIICLRRGAMDSCLANFRQLFALKSPFYDYSFDLLDTGRYYIQFERLMAHWSATFPDRIMHLRYEEIVDDQEGATRRLLEHCGLPWDDACLRFEQNPHPVSTASVVQVRSPIYRSSLQRWKRYGPNLDVLRALLTDAGVSLE